MFHIPQPTRPESYCAQAQIMPPTTAHQTPRIHLFASTFCQVLPAHHEKFTLRLQLLARLYHEASAALLATDRAAGINSLKAELEMLDKDIDEYRRVVRTVAYDDIVDLYVVAGRRRWRAEEIAREDVEGVERGLEELEGRVSEIRADVVYGFEGKE